MVCYASLWTVYMDMDLMVSVLCGDCLVCLSTSMCVQVACLMAARLEMLLPTTELNAELGIVTFLVLCWSE